MSGSRGYLETYEFVDDRIAGFRRDYPGTLGRIETVPLHTGDLCVFEARISVRGLVGDDNATTQEMTLIANAHAMDKWGGASQAEKTEKAAIGRALVMAGYSAKRGASAEEMDRHAEQERSGAAQPPRNATTHRPSTSVQDEKKKQALANLIASIDAFRPSYAAIVAKADQMVIDGNTAEEITEYLKAKKRSMSEDEYANAQKQLGRILADVETRDAKQRAEAEAELSEKADRIAGSIASVGDGKGNHPSIDDDDF